MSDEVGAILAGVRVLYVEDDEDTRSMMVLLLETAGATVAAVASADDAVAILGREQADVLVSDGGLPGQDGWGLIEQIRTWSRARGGKIPAIAVTGSASPADVAHSLQAGFDAHISKPIDVSELLRTMARLVGRGGISNGATA
jgi:CheY-like chemotaxis protein